MSSEPIPAGLAALDREYWILGEIGRGGTAIVYLARERLSGAEVAIKLIRAKYLEDEEAMARFAREARFVASLAHPNVVGVHRVLDLGVSGIALVMTHINGRTLKQVIHDERPLAPEFVVRALREVASALSAAHAMGIIHRDVKPENIFITADGRALLADFGVARSMSSDTQLTMHGVDRDALVHVAGADRRDGPRRTRRHLQPRARGVGDVHRASAVGRREPLRRSVSPAASRAA